MSMLKQKEYWEAEALALREALDEIMRVIGAHRPSEVGGLVLEIADKALDRPAPDGGAQ